MVLDGLLDADKASRRVRGAGDDLTFGELRQAASTLAGTLTRRDRVAVIAERRLETTVAVPAGASSPRTPAAARPGVGPGSTSAAPRFTPASPRSPSTTTTSPPHCTTPACWCRDPLVSPAPCTNRSCAAPATRSSSATA